MTNIRSALIAALTLVAAIPGANAEQIRDRGRLGLTPQTNRTPVLTPQTNRTPLVTPQTSRTPSLRTVQPQRVTRQPTTGTTNRIETNRLSRNGTQKIEGPNKGVTSHNVPREGTGITKAGNVRPVVPSASQTAREGKETLRFVGKPTNVAHDPAHQSAGDRNELGNQKDHLPVAIKRDDKFYERNYYYSVGREGRRTWYWYDVPITDQEIIVKLLPGVPVCPNDSDTCLMADYTPVKVNSCGTDRDVDTKGLGHVKMSCFARTELDEKDACSGSCHVYDPSGADQGAGPVNLPAGILPPNPVVYQWGCHCK
jgi:hypothetical protein